MSDIELKPCPFCGGEAKILFEEKAYGWTVWCECPKCHSRATGYCPNVDKKETALSSIDDCKKLAIEAWNRRISNETT